MARCHVASKAVARVVLRARLGALHNGAVGDALSNGTQVRVDEGDWIVNTFPVKTRVVCAVVLIIAIHQRLEFTPENGVRAFFRRAAAFIVGTHQRVGRNTTHSR